MNWSEDAETRPHFSLKFTNIKYSGWKFKYRLDEVVELELNNYYLNMAIL